jgi:hypothetical protein
MKYRPRQPETRLCVHCHKPYVSAHKRRIYCGNSCANQVSYARRPRLKVLSPTPSLGAVPASTTALASVNLAPSWQNAAILAGSQVAAKLVLVLGERLLQLFTSSPASVPTASPPEPVDPAGWLPAALLSAPAPRLTLTMAWWEQPQVFLQLSYFGHTLYYQPTHYCLLWRAVPGQVLLLSSPAQLAAIAELTPIEHVPAPPAEPLALPTPVPAPLTSSPQAIPSPQFQSQAPIWGLAQAPDRAPDFALDQAPATAG